MTNQLDVSSNSMENDFQIPTIDNYTWAPVTASIEDVLQDEATQNVLDGGVTLATPTLVPSEGGPQMKWTPQQLKLFAEMSNQGVTTEKALEKTALENQQEGNKQVIVGNVDNESKLPLTPNVGNVLSMNNVSQLATPDLDTAVQVMAICKIKTPDLNFPGAPVLTKGEQSLAIKIGEMTKKHNAIKSDLTRLGECRLLKSKLVNRRFQPLNPRSISNFTNVYKIPG